MDLTVRGRKISAEDLLLIRSLITGERLLGRYQLSLELCRQWNWVQFNGKLKDAACRALLLRLHDQGLIDLPERQRGASRQPRPKRLPPPTELIRTVSTPQDFPTDIEWRCANHEPWASIYKDLIQVHHYLGYRREVGPCLRYIAYSGTRPIGCVGWTAAAWKVAPRDQFIGWNDEKRRKNLHRVVNNTRFLVLGRTPHLASHLLARNIRQLALDWEKIYGYAPVLLETFVDTTRFNGTCYKAANWINVGKTQGRGRYDRHTRRPETVKAIYLYPLNRNYRHLLTHD